MTHEVALNPGQLRESVPGIRFVARAVSLTRQAMLATHFG